MTAEQIGLIGFLIGLAIGYPIGTYLIRRHLRSVGLTGGDRIPVGGTGRAGYNGLPPTDAVKPPPPAAPPPKPTEEARLILSVDQGTGEAFAKALDENMPKVLAAIEAALRPQAANDDDTGDIP